MQEEGDISVGGLFYGPSQPQDEAPTQPEVASDDAKSEEKEDLPFDPLEALHFLVYNQATAQWNERERQKIADSDVSATFPAQRHKMRFALSQTLGLDPQTIPDELITPDADVKAVQDGLAMPSCRIAGQLFVAKRFENGAILGVETLCPISGATVITSIKTFADLGEIYHNPPRAPHIADLQEPPTLEEAAFQAAAAVAEGPRNDFHLPVLYYQARQVEEMANQTAKARQMLSLIHDEFFNMADSISRLADVFAPDIEEGPAIPYGDERPDDWKVLILDDQTQWRVEVVPAEEEEAEAIFSFSRDGSAQYVGEEGVKAPQWVFDIVADFAQSQQPGA